MYIFEDYHQPREDNWLEDKSLKDNSQDNNSLKNNSHDDNPWDDNSQDNNSLKDNSLENSLHSRTSSSQAPTGVRIWVIKDRFMWRLYVDKITR